MKRKNLHLQMLRVELQLMANILLKVAPLLRVEISNHLLRIMLQMVVMLLLKRSSSLEREF
jgi:hypothetical protein